MSLNDPPSAMKPTLPGQVADDHDDHDHGESDDELPEMMSPETTMSPSEYHGMKQYGSDMMEESKLIERSLVNGCVCLGLPVCLAGWLAGWLFARLSLRFTTISMCP